MKTSPPLAHCTKIRGGHNNFFTIHELEDEDYYDDDEYEYYEVDEDEEEHMTETSLSTSTTKASSGKRRVVPKAISIRAIGTSIPKLASLPRSVITNSKNLSMDLIKFLSVHAYASASIGAGALCLLLVQIILTRTKILPKVKWGRSRSSKKKKDKKKKYGDYSKGYPEEDEEVVDLDEKSPKKIGLLRKYWVKATNVLVPTALVNWFQNASKCVDSMKAKVGTRLANTASFFWNRKHIDAGTRTEVGASKTRVNIEADISNTGYPAAKENDNLNELQQQLRTLTDSHQSLEQEYEASLRMLHDARLELRQLKSQQSLDANGLSVSQKQQMENTIKNLESKYKQQMKEQIERIRSQTVEKIRAELVEEYDEKLQSQSEQYQQDFLSSQAFQQYVDEASALKVEEAVSSAVEETIEQQQAKSREEMTRVREAIQKVLERERRMMKEQVAKATSQVREWVKRQQLEQLQRREETEVDEEEEDVAMVGDVFDERLGGSRERYTGSTFYDERRRGVEQRRQKSTGKSVRQAIDESDDTTRDNYYPSQSNEYQEEYDEVALNGEDDGTAGEFEHELLQERTPQRSRQSNRYSSTNIYKEAAKRKQQRRREQGI